MGTKDSCNSLHCMGEYLQPPPPPPPPTSPKIRFAFVCDIKTVSSSLVDRLPLSYLARFHAAFGLSMVAILICLLNVAVTLVNSYQSVTTWWRGPTMMYLLSLLASKAAIVEF